MIPGCLAAVVYPDTRARLTDLIARRVRRTRHTRAPAHLLGERRCAFYTRRATITWPHDDERIARTARRVYVRVPTVRRREEEEDDDDQGVEEERKAHTRAWFQ